MDTDTLARETTYLDTCNRKFLNAYCMRYINFKRVAPRQTGHLEMKYATAHAKLARV